MQKSMDGCCDCMTTYVVINTPLLEKKLNRYVDYLLYVKKNEQAAHAVFDDYIETRKSLETIAGSLQDPPDENLRKRNLKRINFQRHNYFLLFRINDDTVEIATMFHGSEDYSDKLDSEDISK